MLILFLVVMVAATFAPTEFFRAGAQMPQSSHASTVPGATEVRRDVEALPEAVQDMRLSILRAAASGDLEEMLYVMQRNEIMPLLSARERVPDALAHFRARSADGAGAQIMAALVNILTTGFVVVAQRDTEMYVWPHFAETGVGELEPRETVELYRLVPHERLTAMRETGVYDYFRLGIGRDGTWHFFHDDE